MTIELEPFAPTDAEGVASLILAIQREEYGLSITLDEQPDLRDIPRFYGQGAGGFWVARDGERVVGTIGLLDIGDRQAALRKMFVSIAHRGRGARGEPGTAQRLLDSVIGHAIRCGLTDLFLGTTDRFLAAHRFYERNAFIRVDPQALPRSFPRMAVDSRFYRRRLAVNGW